MDRPTDEALCDLQAQACVLRMALRALIRLNPDPEAALASLRDVLAESERHSPTAPSYARNSEHFADRYRAFVEDLLAEWVELAVPPNGDKAAPGAT